MDSRGVNQHLAPDVWVSILRYAPVPLQNLLSRSCRAARIAYLRQSDWQDLELWGLADVSGPMPPEVAHPDYVHAREFRPTRVYTLNRLYLDCPKPHEACVRRLTRILARLADACQLEMQVPPRLEGYVDPQGLRWASQFIPSLLSAHLHNKKYVLGHEELVLRAPQALMLRIVASSTDEGIRRLGYPWMLARATVTRQILLCRSDWLVPEWLLDENHRVWSSVSCCDLAAAFVECWREIPDLMYTHPAGGKTTLCRRVVSRIREAKSGSDFISLPGMFHERWSSGWSEEQIQSALLGWRELGGVRS